MHAVKRLHHALFLLLMAGCIGLGFALYQQRQELTLLRTQREKGAAMNVGNQAAPQAERPAVASSATATAIRTRKADRLDAEALQHALKDIDGEMNGLWRRLQLTPSQIIQAETAIALARYATGDALADLHNRGFDSGKDAPAFEAAFKPMRDAIDATENAELQSILGAAGFAEYVKFWRNAATEEFVNRDVQSYLAKTGVSLTDGQAEQLVQLMAQSQYRTSVGLNEQGLGIASGILTKQQLQALRRFQDLLSTQWKLESELSEIRRRLSPTARPGG